VTPTESPSLEADGELMSLAESVLDTEGYELEIRAQAPLPVLFAENSFFLLAVVTLATISELLVAEPIASSVLSDRLSEVDVGPKRWDVYLVLLTQERLTEGSDATRTLFEINHDTSRVRRIAHSGVSPTLAGVRLALNPFLAPIALEDPAATDEPLEMLTEALVEHGVDRSIASRVVQAFRHGVPISDGI
jgi:hypothetical protein